jgi:MYXO-CTERM domain-containing protein
MKHSARTHALGLALATTSLLVATAAGVPHAEAADWHRTSTAPSDRPAVEVASRFVAEGGRGPLHLADATLAHKTTMKLGRGSAVRFEQRHEGVLVDGRSVAVRVGADGRVRGAMVDVARGLDVDTTPVVSLADAYEAGVLQLPFAIGRMVRSELVIMTTGPKPALAWRMDVLDARGGGRIYVDAHDGTLRGYRTLASQARGLVYEQNSVTTPDPIEVTLDTLDTKAEPIRLNGWDGLLQVTNYVSGGQQGGYEVEQIVGPSEGEDFLYDPPASETDDDDEFSQVGLFYHLTEHRNFFRDDLGVDVDQPDWKITAVANMQEGGAPLDNAFFSPAGLDGTDFDAPNLIGIGQGTEVDFASDSDVFKHEFGHYISDQAVGYNLGQLGFTEYGLSPHSGSVDEGIADYFACSENGDPILGEATLATFGSARELTDTSKTCPADMVGEVHEDGELVGSLGWTLRENFGRTIADQLVWGAVSLMPSGGTLGDFAAGIAETAQELLDAGDLDEEDVAGIDAFIAERGLDECGAVLPLPGEEPLTTTIIGLDQVGQAFQASCADLQGFVEMQSIFHFSGSAPDAESATFHVDLEALGPGDIDYRLVVRAGEHVGFVNGSFLPTPGVYDYEADSQGESLDLVIDASSDPPFDPAATYYAVLMSSNCPFAQVEISLRAGGSSGEGGGAVASGATASVGVTTGPTTSAASGVAPTTAAGTNAAVGAGGGGDEAAEGDGCDCRTTPGAPSGGAGAVALAAAAWVAARRRKRAS